MNSNISGLTGCSVVYPVVMLIKKNKNKTKKCGDYLRRVLDEHTKDMFDLPPLGSHALFTLK